MGSLPPKSHMNLSGISNIKYQKYSKHRADDYLTFAEFQDFPEHIACIRMCKGK